MSNTYGSVVIIIKTRILDLDEIIKCILLNHKTIVSRGFGGFYESNTLIIIYDLTLNTIRELDTRMISKNIKHELEY